MGVYSQQTIKAINKKNIYMLIIADPGISWIQLENVTILIKTTVSALVDELIHEGYVTDEGSVESNRQGRKPNSLVVNSDGNCFLVINWRKRILETAIVTSSFEVEHVSETEVKIGENYAVQIEQQIKECIERRCGSKKILGICLVVPGMIDSEQEEIISMVLTLDEKEKVIQELRARIQKYPLAVFNDTACLAYAENAFGDMKGRNYVYLNMNEGVGAALVYEGNILKGATGMGTQFGHFSVDKNGEKCVCGNRGCLENRIGELALAKIAKECHAEGAFRDLATILFKDVGNLAAEGNQDALKMVEVLAADLSYALGNLIAMFNPESVVIGGMGRKLGDIFLQELQENVKATGFQQFVSKVDIRFTRLKEEALLQGAAKYYMDMHYKFLEDMTDKLFLY